MPLLTIVGPPPLGSFNWVDVVGVILLVRCAYVGVRLGVSNELTKLIGLVMGILVSFRWYQLVGDWVATRSVLSHEWAAVGALLVLTGSVYLAVGLLLRLLQKVVTMQCAPALDKTGGALAAVIRAGLVMSLIVVMCQQLPSDAVRASVEERSWSGPYLARIAPAMYDRLTPVLQRVFPGLWESSRS